MNCSHLNILAGALEKCTKQKASQTPTTFAIATTLKFMTHNCKMFQSGKAKKNGKKKLLPPIINGCDFAPPKVQDIIASSRM